MSLPAHPSPGTMTVEEFFEYPEVEGKAELVRGELRVTPPAGGAHGRAGTNLLLSLGSFVRTHGLGDVFGDGVGYVLLAVPRTVRVPDASFVRADRLPPEGVGREALRFAPDLAVEVLSPSETASEIQEKLDDYLTAGTSLIWVADPQRRSVNVVSPDAPLRRLHEGDSLDGGAVIPGFTCQVDEIFAGVFREG